MGVQKRQASACDASKPGRSTAASKTQPMMFKEAEHPFRPPAPRVLGFRASRKPRRKGMGKGAAAPPFPCLFCSRTDRISVLTGQGRSSSCKIWEVGTQSPLTWTFQPSSILLPSGFRSLDGRALSLEKTGNLGFPVFCSQQSDYPISCHLQMAAQFAISVLRIMERRELRDA